MSVGCFPEAAKSGTESAGASLRTSTWEWSQTACARDSNNRPWRWQRKMTTSFPSWKKWLHWLHFIFLTHFSMFPPNSNMETNGNHTCEWHRKTIKRWFHGKKTRYEHVKTTIFLSSGFVGLSKHVRFTFPWPQLTESTQSRLNWKFGDAMGYFRGRTEGILKKMVYQYHVYHDYNGIIIQHFTTVWIQGAPIT